MGIRSMLQDHGREQWHTHQSYDNRRAILAIRPHGLAENLPVLYEEHQRRRCDTDVLIDRFVAECPEVYPRCRFNPLREEEVREVYYVTIRELSRSSLGGSSMDHSDITHIWLQRLERLIEVDRADARMSGTSTNQIFVHRRSNHLFRALAEVSYANRSIRIGQILHSFFVRYVSQIVTTETSATVGQWCNAVLRATMTETQRAECFRRVYELRPDLPNSLRRYGRRGQLVAESIERLSMGMSVERRGIGFERPALGFRSRSAGMLGGDAGLYGIGGRSSSYERRGLMARGLGAGGLLDGEMHELDDLGSGMMHRLGSDRHLFQDDMAGQHRLLELSMGPRYASRFDEMGGMDGMSMLTLGDESDEMFGTLGGDAMLSLDDSLEAFGI